MSDSPTFCYPKLRPLQISSQPHNGSISFILQDPARLAEGALIVPQVFGPILALCDGSQPDIASLQTTLQHETGLRVDKETIVSLLNALDEAYLLVNERSEAALAGQRHRFRSQPYRAPLLAGHAYPHDAADLARQLDGLLSACEPYTGHYGVEARGIFSPHIDYDRGGSVYAATWQAVAPAVEEAELAIIVGTDHYGNDLITLTHQHYATPYGVLPTDTAVVDELARTLGHDQVFCGEMRHANEHSIELVAVWLHHMRQGRSLPIVPILCGSLHAYYNQAEKPDETRPIRTFLETLQPLLADRRVLVVASGDLAHVGPAFGGPALTVAARERLRLADESLLNRLGAGDADGFLREIAAVNDRNNVCGVTPGYLALKLMGDVQGEQIAYASCTADEQNRSAVTICGVVYGNRAA